MPRGYPPSVFVSSTCYDLSQVRRDLKDFIESLGYVAMISENSAFPVNPQATAAENCLAAVRDRADIFVLMIGARFGSPQKDGRSITNLEYLEAKAKHLPIYVFVMRTVLSHLDTWKKNPTGNFSHVVDDPRLFEFVDHLRNQSGTWAYEFDVATDITTTLRQQWGILFTDALLTRAQLQSSSYSAELMKLPSESLKILLERRPAWEGRLFSAVLKNEIESLSSLRHDFRYQLRLRERRKLVGPVETMDWISGQMQRAVDLVQSAKSLLEIGFKEGMKPKGVPADPDLLVYVARRIGEADRQLLQWRLGFLQIDVEQEYERLVEIVSGFSDHAIEKLESLPSLMDDQLEKAEEAMSRGEGGVVDVQLVFDSPKLDGFMAEMERLKAVVGFGGI